MNQDIKKALPFILLAAAFGLGAASWQNYSGTLILQNQIKDYADKNTNLRSTLERVDGFASFIKENSDVIDKFDSVLPDNDNKPSLLSNFGNMSFLNGLMLKKITFAEAQNDQAVQDAMGSFPVVSSNDYETLTADLSLSGNYSAFKNFLNSLESNLKLMDISHISFRPIATGGSEDENSSPAVINYDFAVNVKTYYLKNKGNGNQSILADFSQIDKLADFSFTTEKQFMDLSLPQNYTVDTTDTGDLSNKNIF